MTQVHPQYCTVEERMLCTNTKLDGIFVVLRHLCACKSGMMNYDTGPSTILHCWTKTALYQDEVRRNICGSETCVCLQVRYGELWHRSIHNIALLNKDCPVPRRSYTKYLWFWDICVVAIAVWWITTQVHPQYCTVEQRMLCTKTKLDRILFFPVSLNLQGWWAFVHKIPIWVSVKNLLFLLFHKGN
jgi:hypothetical protein